MGTAIEFLKDLILHRFGTSGCLLILLVAVCIYAWYQHYSKKLLKERIALDAETRRQLGETMLAVQKTVESLPPPPPASHRAFKVLVIDDEAEIVITVKTHLQRTIPGVIVFTANDGVSGLAAVKRESPDIIFMDVVMPNQNGFEVLQELKRLGINTPTVMISGYMLNLEEINDRSGVFRSNLSFLAKPFRLAEVSEIVKDSYRISEK